MDAAKAAEYEVTKKEIALGVNTNDNISVAIADAYLGKLNSIFAERGASGVQEFNGKIQALTADLDASQLEIFY
jgi:hypothetical protein